MAAEHDGGVDVVGCLECDLMAGRRHLPGGPLYETSSWTVNHDVGSMNLGTLVVSPREHVVALADVDDLAARELGDVLRVTARVVQVMCEPEQVYVGMWSHGADGRRHLLFVVQPATSSVIAEYGGVRGEQLQARMLADGQARDVRDVRDVEEYCDQARALFVLIDPE